MQNHVAAVFHGHDHLHAEQDLDGIVYQEVPQPGDPNGSSRSAAEYGYTNGVILGSSGYLRVSVSSEQVRVEYLRASPTGSETAHAYTILPTTSRR